MDADGLLVLGQLCSQSIAPSPAGSQDAGIIHATVPCKYKRGGKNHHNHCEAAAAKDPGAARVSLADVPKWAAPRVLGTIKWPFKQITDGEAPYYWPQVFRRAANLYRNSSYEAIVQGLPEGGVTPKYVLDLTEPYEGPWQD
jgi:hypothetical protein